MGASYAKNLGFAISIWPGSGVVRGGRGPGAGGGGRVVLAPCNDIMNVGPASSELGSKLIPNN